MTKSQVISVDVIIAFSLFVFVLIASYQLYQYTDVRHKQQIELERVSLQSDVAFRHMFHTTGEPFRWHEIDELEIDFIGLQSQGIFLHPDKIIALESLENGTSIARRIGLSIQYTVFGTVQRYNDSLSEFEELFTFGESGLSQTYQRDFVGVDTKKRMYLFQLRVYENE